MINILQNISKINTLIIGFGMVAIYMIAKTSVTQAVCATPPNDYGTATITFNLPANDSYRVWSRIKAPDTTNNSYYLEVDGGSCITVGDSAITADTWTWVDYQNGNTATKIDLTLTAGSHTFKLIGREPGVSLDLIVMTTDETCLPTGFGTLCSNPPDTTLPTVSLSSPLSNATLSGTATISATASDDVGVTRVEFLVDNTIINSDATSPYSYAWNTTTIADGLHTIVARAFDAANNTRSTTAINVTVSNSAPPPPLKPGDVNGDSKVDVFDLSILATNYGRSGMTRSQGDLNNDTVVNVFDLSILAGNWGN